MHSEKHRRLKDAEAGSQVEYKVMSFLECISSFRRYFPRTLMNDLNKVEYAIVDKMKDGELHAVCIINKAEKDDEEDSKEWKELKKPQLRQLAEMRKKYGGMDICALSIDKNGNTRSEYIEVKADRNCKFLFRDIPAGVTDACLGFELWDHVYYKDENGKMHKNERDKWKNGWLHGYMHPQDHNDMLIADFQQEIAKGKSNPKSPPLYTTPSVLIFGLENEERLTEPNEFGHMWEAWPYVYVCFEDTNALFEFLNSKLDGKLSPWTIDKENIEELEGYKDLIFMNMLYVPLKELVNLPGVTITIRRKHFPNIDTVRGRALDEKVPFDEKVFRQRVKFLNDHETSEEERKQRLDALEIKKTDSYVKDLDLFTDDFNEKYSDKSKPINIFYVPVKK